MTNGAGFVALATDGELTNILGIPIRLIALGSDTGGQFEALTGEFLPGQSFAPHIHRNSDESFYILDGEIEMRVGDRIVNLTAGAFGFTPRGIVHGFENKGSRPAKLLAWSLPAWGASDFVKALAALPPGAPDMDRVIQILREFDIDPVM